jgi:protein SCO1/2
MSPETNAPKKPKLASTLLLGAFVMVAIGASMLLLLNLSRQPAAQEATPRPTNTPNVGAGESVTLIDPGRILTDFAFPASTGETMSLSDFSGKVVLLYFGYANCPDFCPTTMAQFAAVGEALGDQAENVQGLLISVDPARDTPEALAEFVTRFDPSFIGLQGDEAGVRAIADEYGLDFSIPTADATAEATSLHADHQMTESGGYLVNHTVSSYLVDQDGRLRAVFSYGTPTGEMVETVGLFVET